MMAIALSLSASNVRGNTKKAIVNAMYFIGYSVGCIVGPQLWTHKPRYTSGIILDLVTWGVWIVAVAAYWYICARENKRRESLPEGHISTYQKGQDVTDKEDLTFRYSY